MGCGTGVVKFVMFFFNFIFVVGGILMVTAGVMSLTGYQDYQHFVDLELDSYKAPPILLIAVGCAVFLIAFMGCCGVLRENNCMMMTYAVFMSIILLIQVGIAVAAHVYEDDFKDVLTKGMQKSIDKYEGKKEVREAWDTMQNNLKCCGYDSYNDWRKINKVPQSCCIKVEEGCSNGVIDNPSQAKEKVYTEGCVDKAFGQLRVKWVIIAASVIAGVEFIGILFACCLAARFRRKNYA
jgi:CD63 antigen